MTSVHRQLQRHLDRQAVGFPATWSGADLRVLERLFTPDEARLALHLADAPRSTAEVAGRAGLAGAAAAALLEAMLHKGAIGWRERDGVSLWNLLPLVVGMWECQDGAPAPGLLADVDAYMATPSFGLSFLAVKPSQMRTIPVGASIPVAHAVATYDQIGALVDASPGPFAVLPCICRRDRAMSGERCARTTREETCLAFADGAGMVLRRGHGREVTRDEVRAILARNQEDGLVLQPANTQRPDFVCSCCGCCCGMLRFQRRMPHPLDFWTSSFTAAVAAALCTGCGVCVERCQVGAVRLEGEAATIDAARCIGCGLCVPTCATEATRLLPRAAAPPPVDDDALRAEIRANKPGGLGRLAIAAKVLLKREQ